MIQIKRGTSNGWSTSTNNKLNFGQLGVNLTLGELRVGNTNSSTAYAYSSCLPITPPYMSFPGNNEYMVSISSSKSSATSGPAGGSIVIATKESTDANLITPAISNVSTNVYFTSIRLRPHTIDLIPFTYSNSVKTASVLTVQDDYSSSGTNGVYVTASKAGQATKTATGFNLNAQKWGIYAIGYYLSPNSSGSMYLGCPTHKWYAVYATVGQIQSSDKKSKTNIKSVKYIDNSVVADSTIESPGFDGGEVQDVSELTLNKIIDFIKVLNPVTFRYRRADGTPDATPASVQLGLIADEIKNFDITLFNYIGVTDLVKVPNPEIFEQITDKTDKNFLMYKRKETGEISRDLDISDDEKITEERLGLQPLPVATLALAVCQYLVKEIEKLKEKS